MNSRIHLQAKVTEDLAGLRLDQAAARLFPDYSRSRIQTWIEEGALRVNGESWRSRDKVHCADHLSVNVALCAEDTWVAEAMPLDIVYEDPSLLVINKPAGAVVHPAAGHRAGTLLNGLLHYHPQLELVPRAGIVHRLDKDTTGLMVVAKTIESQISLVRQLQARDVYREYEAIVWGVLTGGGTIDQPLGRHPTNRKRQAVREDGKAAVTHFKVLRRFAAHTLVQVKLETGRTHQIRVHFACQSHPLVGDRTYGGRPRVPAGCSEALLDKLRSFPRQALHARRLGLSHPESGKAMNWERPAPPDFQDLVNALAEDESQ